MKNDHYPSFIQEAFINPIRSVLIVDDDFPTYDDFLDLREGPEVPEGVGIAKEWRTQRDRISKLIKKFRQGSQPLLVDIHDGTNLTQNEEVTTAKHLHQCDLLVLDYELDKAMPGDPTRAIEILRAVMSNAHFNLVVVYTKSELETVFDAIRWGIVSPLGDSLEPIEEDNAKELIARCEDIDARLGERLSEAVGGAQYFHSRQNQPTYLRMMLKGAQPYATFVAEANSAGWNNDQKKIVLRYLLKRLEEENCSSHFGRLEALEWSADGPNWIKSDSAFIAFSRKVRDGDPDLMSDLKEALHQWSPRPSRLFLTKLRAEIDDYGIAAQGSALRNHHALAYWYNQLLESNSESDRKWQIAESVKRHSEQLLQEVRPRVEDFVEDLIKSEENAGTAVEICRNHFNVDLSEDKARLQAALEHNAFVCSKTPEGWHLDTGQVFTVFEGNSEELWLCLSPTCDMVPSQIPMWRIASVGEHLPFLAVKLQPSKANKALEKISSNRYVCLDIGGEISCYCFNDPVSENSSPHWHIFYAQHRGKFSGEGFQFTVARVRKDTTKLILESVEARVVAQLRYEYALNLIQKLGVSLTRIGLGFDHITVEDD